MSWQALDAVPAQALSRARQQAHHAAQILAAVGETLLEPLPDTSQTALGWCDVLGALQGHPIPQADAARVALRLSPFELVVADAAGRIVETLPLAGSTRQELGTGAMQALSARAGRDLGKLVYPDYELPPHPLAEGARFESDDHALTQLQHWYANAHGALRAVSGLLPRPGAILCWPHHFDIATLASVERDAAGAATKTLGVGLSPGDESIDEPYWYVSRWPAASADGSPPLEVGEWAEDFAGTLLRAREVTSRKAGQRELVMGFLEAAIAANLALLAH